MNGKLLIEGEKCNEAFLGFFLEIMRQNMEITAMLRMLLKDRGFDVQKIMQELEIEKKKMTAERIDLLYEMFGAIPGDVQDILNK